MMSALCDVFSFYNLGTTNTVKSKNILLESIYNQPEPLTLPFVNTLISGTGLPLSGMNDLTTLTHSFNFE